MNSNVLLLYSIYFLNSYLHIYMYSQPHGQCVRGEVYNYTVLVWQEGTRQPVHVEGPFQVSSCEGTLDVPVYGLRRAQHYTASIVVYNDNISLKSKKINLCELLIIIIIVHMHQVLYIFPY